jgi:acyl-CoA synthetase (AMP-forming)/AMP-acid ligase II
VLNDAGWFRTGDLGQIIDGQVIWLSRLKDIIRVSGENVAASEIEDVLLAAEPRIAEVAVVAGPDSRRGEVPIAFVRTRDGDVISADALLVTCREMLADFKVPREVRFVDDFPRTEATNRIQKEKLRARLRDEANASDRYPPH